MWQSLLLTLPLTLISCKLSFPNAGLKISLPTFALKSPKKMFMLYFGNSSNIHSNYSQNLSLDLKEMSWEGVDWIHLA